MDESALPDDAKVITSYVQKVNRPTTIQLGTGSKAKTYLVFQRRPSCRPG